MGVFYSLIDAKSSVSLPAPRQSSEKTSVFVDVILNSQSHHLVHLQYRVNVLNLLLAAWLAAQFLQLNKILILLAIFNLVCFTINSNSIFFVKLPHVSKQLI